MADDNDKQIELAVKRAVWESEMSTAIDNLTEAVHTLSERVQQLEKRYLIVCAILVLIGQAVGIGVGEMLQHFVAGGPIPPVP